ncbi:MAG TPA: DUF4352 domain-containing protein [Thermomicrobiales bacterium]|nr:DUF4352 domain-containing protein [Thermomicrobiales bacterium]
MRPSGGASAGAKRAIALANATPAATSEAGRLTPPVAADIGLNRSRPVPLGHTVAAGPLEMRVFDVRSGRGAVAAVRAASPGNDPPRDGVTYVIVRLAVRNTGDAPVAISGNDFGLTGASGVVQRFLDVIPPDPPRAATVPPGAATDGWVVFAMPDGEQGLLLLFDSVSIPGNWADRVLALESQPRSGATPAAGEA